MRRRTPQDPIFEESIRKDKNGVVRTGGNFRTSNELYDFILDGAAHVGTYCVESFQLAFTSPSVSRGSLPTDREAHKGTGRSGRRLRQRRTRLVYLRVLK